MSSTGSNIKGSASKRLFIGIGNEYRSDDGVGLFLAQNLRRANLPGTRIIEAGGEGTDLIAAWQGADLVVVADAVYSSSEPGAIFRFVVPGASIPKALFSRRSTHAFGLLEAVELAKTMGTLPEKLVIYGIEGRKFEAGIELSLEVEQAVKEVELRIKKEFA